MTGQEINLLPVGIQLYYVSVPMSFPAGGSQSKTVKTVNHDFWVSGFTYSLYLDGKRISGTAEDTDEINIQVSDKGYRSPLWGSSGIDQFTLRDTGMSQNFKGFQLRKDTELEISVTHTKSQITSGTLKLILTFFGKYVRPDEVITDATGGLR